jgi:predicted transcriptional regulator of viral defense system
VETRTLSAVEARIVLSLEAEDRAEVSLDSIQKRARVSRGYARKLAHTLVTKGWLQRVGRGEYLLSPARHGPGAYPDTDPLRFGSRIASPYYFGFATAAELLGLLPQASRVYYIVTTARGGARLVHAAQFRRIRIAPERFFGTKQLTRRGETVVVSDLERTLLDCLARPDLGGGLGGVLRMLESAGRNVDWRRLDRYLARLGQRSLALRLGFLVEQLPEGPQPPSAWLRRTVARPAEPYVPLGPPREFGRRGAHDARWHVIRNVPDSLLHAEVDLR